MKLTISRLLLAAMITLFYACGGSTDSESGTSAQEEGTEQTEQAGEAEGEGEGEGVGEAAGESVQSITKGDITVTPLSGSPDFPNAKLSLKGKVEDGGDGTHTFNFDVKNYDLGAQTDKPAPLANSGKGQHIHFIVDNGPYSAHYDPAVTTEKLKEDGNHVVLAFLSRSYHESVKNKKSFVVTQVKTGDEDAAEADLTAMHMFYSRPKGTYKGEDTKKLLLDFFLLNVDEGLSQEGYKVHTIINGEEFLLTKWQPYVIEGLPMGEVEIKMTLVDGKGDMVPGPFNTVTRKVTLAPADPS
ncbi:MAG: hypothetical protein AAF696_10460 [Bacteroidota bacterium]